MSNSIISKNASTAHLSNNNPNILPGAVTLEPSHSPQAEAIEVKQGASVSPQARHSRAIGTWNVEISETQTEVANTNTVKCIRLLSELVTELCFAIVKCIWFLRRLVTFLCFAIPVIFDLVALFLYLRHKVPDDVHITLGVGLAIVNSIYIAIICINCCCPRRCNGHCTIDWIRGA